MWPERERERGLPSRTRSAFVLGKEDTQKRILRERINIRRSEIKQGEKRNTKGKTKKKKERK